MPHLSSADLNAREGPDKQTVLQACADMGAARACKLLLECRGDEGEALIGRQVIKGVTK